MVGDGATWRPAEIDIKLRRTVSGAAPPKVDVPPTTANGNFVPHPRHKSETQRMAAFRLWCNGTRRLEVFGSFLGLFYMRVIRTPCRAGVLNFRRVEDGVVVVD